MIFSVRNFMVYFLMMLLIIASSYYPAESASLQDNARIIFYNYCGNKLINSEADTFYNALNQPFTVSKFRYYISELKLNSADGKTYFTDEFFLVDNDDSASRIIKLNVNQGNYESISFTLGVDSIHSCSGAQTGALDPVQGMYWTWNSGYIFLKMEGKSPMSNSPGNLLEFHIGGYRSNNNCLRKFTIPLGSALNINSSASTEIIIKSDLLELFQSPTAIDFSDISSVTDYHNAVTIADNYKDMFSLLKIRP